MLSIVHEKSSKLEPRGPPKKEEQRVGVAGLKTTRDDNSKGTRIGPSYFYTSELRNKYINIIL